MEFALPHTILYQNADHSDDNSQWNETVFGIDNLTSLKTGAIDSRLQVYDDIKQSFVTLKEIIEEVTPPTTREARMPEITCEQAFMLAVKQRMFSMGDMIKPWYNPEERKLTIDYPKGFSPNYIHLIGKRQADTERTRYHDWLTLLVSMDGDSNYGDLAYVPHSLLQFALKNGHYSLSANSPIIAPFLAKGPEEPSTDWDQLLNN
tara:strand:+ start:211 stop:825 length:615 start_codon:yes stop_codon:yes gene_type:complete